MAAWRRGACDVLFARLEEYRALRRALPYVSDVATWAMAGLQQRGRAPAVCIRSPGGPREKLGPVRVASDGVARFVARDAQELAPWAAEQARKPQEAVFVPIVLGSEDVHEASEEEKRAYTEAFGFVPRWLGGRNLAKDMIA